MLTQNFIKLPGFSLTAREISSVVIYENWDTLLLFFGQNVKCRSSFSSCKMNVHNNKNSLVEIKPSFQEYPTVMIPSACCRKPALKSLKSQRLSQVFSHTKSHNSVTRTLNFSAKQNYFYLFRYLVFSLVLYVSVRPFCYGVWKLVVQDPVYHKIQVLILPRMVCLQKQLPCTQVVLFKKPWSLSQMGRYRTWPISSLLNSKTFPGKSTNSFR